MSGLDTATAYWDAVQPGDPIPPWENSDGGPLCWAPNHAGYACVRPRGHADQHVAPRVGFVISAWGAPT